LDNTRAAQALGEILIRVTDNRAFETHIPSRNCRRGRERVIRFELHHGPDGAGCREYLIE
jgi:hypothetical protein